MSNAYDSTRGNTTDRQRRKEWLLATYRANVDYAPGYTDDLPPEWSAAVFGTGLPACRCYRCGKLLTIDTMTVDRIIPGCQGGTYRRNNIRPSCADCANKQGAELRAENRNRVPVVRPRVPQLAARNAPAGRDDEGAVSMPDVQAPGASDLRRNGKVA